MSEKIYTKEDMIDFHNWLAGKQIGDIINIEDWKKWKKENEIVKGFIPKRNIDYNFYYIGENGWTYKAEYTDTKYGYNYFQTEEKAKKVPNELFMAMWNWKMYNDDVEIKEDADHFTINIKAKCVMMYGGKIYGVIPYFSSIEKAEQCLKWLESEKLI